MAPSAPNPTVYVELEQQTEKDNESVLTEGTTIPMDETGRQLMVQQKRQDRNTTDSVLRHHMMAITDRLREMGLDDQLEVSIQITNKVRVADNANP